MKMKEMDFKNNITTFQSITPFLKWAGGKRWFVSRHSNILPTSYRRYIEPFLGGGSVFFHLQPKEASLGDSNKDLINAYMRIKDDWQTVESLLKHHHRRHSGDYYYHIRKYKPVKESRQAAKFIYLNRTCFNGIYRVNLAGEFNVPKGTKDTVIFDSDNFQKLSKLLQNAELQAVDFEELVNDSRKNDFLFIDPPYTVNHNINGFIKYNEKLFSWDDQERLAKALAKAKRRGTKIICTNACHTSIKDLYGGYHLDFQTVSRYSSISANSATRNQFEELLITANL